VIPLNSNKEAEGIVSEILSLAKRKPLKGEDLSINKNEKQSAVQQLNQKIGK
jgi:hypothetical protein